MAIKTSLMPTVIHKGSVAITSLVDQPIGECYLQAHIGTTSQLQSYLSIPKEFPKQPEPIQPFSPQKPVQEEKPTTQREEGTLEDLTQLLAVIDHQ